MSLEMRKKEVTEKISALTSKKQLTASERSQLSALVSQAAEIRDDEQRAARATAAVRQSARSMACLSLGSERSDVWVMAQRFSKSVGWFATGATTSKNIFALI